MIKFLLVIFFILVQLSVLSQEGSPIIKSRDSVIYNFEGLLYGDTILFENRKKEVITFCSQIKSHKSLKVPEILMSIWGKEYLITLPKNMEIMDVIGTCDKLLDGDSGVEGEEYCEQKAINIIQHTTLLDPRPKNCSVEVKHYYWVKNIETEDIGMVKLLLQGVGIKEEK